MEEAVNATCETCPFWQRREAESSGGFCLRYPAGTHVVTLSNGITRMITENPPAEALWWCGEHPLRQRDRIAAMAMPAASRRWLADEWDSTTPGIIAADAYAVADAMLAESAKGTK